MRETATKTVTQEVVTATVCDACGKRAEGYGPDGWVRFSSHHGDWGNDSIESHDRWDACSFPCYVAIVDRVVDDYGEGHTLEVDDKDLAFLRGMLATVRPPIAESAPEPLPPPTVDDLFTTG